MAKYLFYLLVLSFIVIPEAGAAVYKGQRIFVKQCVECHKDRQAFIAEKKRREWKKLFKKKGKPLADIHLNNKEAKKSWKYFKSKKFVRKQRHLKQFLMEYAKDSGNVPACN